jgi:hypothetical protein
LADNGKIFKILGRYLNYSNIHQIMREITTELKMDSMGRVMIPKTYREELGLKPGQLIKVVISNPYQKEEKD